MAKITEFRGSGVVVQFDEARCLHAGACIQGAPQIFDIHGRPWIRPERGDAALIIEVVARCPSGALTVRHEDGRAAEALPHANIARLVPGGPVYLHGNLQVCDGEGKRLLETTRAALCRCGHSSNKPWCDNSHQARPFEDDGTFAADASMADSSAEDASAAAQPLTVTVFPNGPAQCDGPLTITDAFGEVAWRGTQCWLCRCGASQNKPFCDGSHKSSGFTG